MNFIPGAAYVRLENPKWDGTKEGRIYGVDVVWYDDGDRELRREYLPQPPQGGDYPHLSRLQATVDEVNRGMRRLR